MSRHHGTSTDDRPPAAACSLFVGPVMHARLKPKPHRFSYRVFSMLIDLDRIDDAARIPILSHNRFNLFSFHDRDHGPRDGTSLRAFVDRELEAAGLSERAERVLLLCYPRVLGYVFNPISVYFCYGKSGELICLIYEVRNTFGGIHAYTLPVEPGETSPAGLRQEQDKLFYVSPFIQMAMRYAFRVRLTEDEVRLRILESDEDGPLLSATFAGDYRPATSAQLLKLFCLVPFATLKIIGAIHFEALRLWIKGIPAVPRRPQKQVAGSTATQTTGDQSIHG